MELNRTFKATNRNIAPLGFARFPPAKKNTLNEKPASGTVLDGNIHFSLWENVKMGSTTLPLSCKLQSTPLNYISISNFIMEILIPHDKYGMFCLKWNF